MNQLGLPTMISRLFASAIFAIIIWVMGIGVALAQPKPGRAAPEGKDPSSSKRRSINFEDQLIEGQAQKPELFYLLQQRNANFKRLIRLRENFLPEMRKSAEDVGRSGGARGGN